MEKTHPWRKKRSRPQKPPAPPSISSIRLFESERKITPIVVQEYEVRVDYRPISLFFRELGFERSQVFLVRAVSSAMAEEKAVEKFRQVFDRSRAAIVEIETKR